MENPNTQDSSILGNCLACQGLVRVPVKAPASSKVRCPHCTKSFLLSQILDQAIPELELLDDSAAPSTTNGLLVDSKGASKDESGRFVVAPQLSKGSKRPHRKTEDGEIKRGSSNSRSRRRSSVATTSDEIEAAQFTDTQQVEEKEPSPVDEFAVTEGQSSNGRRSRNGRSRGPGRGSERSSRRSSERSSGSGRSSSQKEEYEGRRGTRRSRSSNAYPSSNNPAVEAFKVIVGGILAIPIAYLLVLWVFGQDPLQVGPTIGKTVPFAVPAKFRAEEEEDELNSGENGDTESSDETDPTNEESPNTATAASRSESSDTGKVDILDVSGLPLPALDPGKVGKN